MDLNKRFRAEPSDLGHEEAAGTLVCRVVANEPDVSSGDVGREDVPQSGLPFRGPLELDREMLFVAPRTRHGAIRKVEAWASGGRQLHLPARAR